MKNYPIISFFTRVSTWLMLCLMLAGNWIVYSKHVWYWVQLPADHDGTPGAWIGITLVDILGAQPFTVAMSSILVLMTLFIRHLYYRQTIDRDIHDGTYVKDWRNMGTDMGARHRIWVSNVVFLGILLALCILCAGLAKGDVMDTQRQRWDQSQINPRFSVSLDVEVARYRRLAPRYQAITVMRENGVPAPVLYCLHQRESSGSFLCHPHEGSSLTHRTRFVPKGRLPYPDPPYTFQQSAEDAYYVCDHLDRVEWSDVAHALQGIESFNGLGYQKFHPETPSPYLWSATNIYKRGKYTGDGRFSRTAIDGQLGCVAILKRMQDKGVEMAWHRAVLVP